MTRVYKLFDNMYDESSLRKIVMYLLGGDLMIYEIVF